MATAARVWRGVTRILDRSAVRRWARVADKADDLDLDTLKGLRDRAWALRRRIDRVLHVAEGRMQLPRIGHDAIARPLHCDWAYRPELWRGPLTPPGIAAIETNTRIGDEASLFHDCRISEITFRQVRNTRADDVAPFGARIDVFAFDGSFLSLVLDLPPDAVAGLKRRHLMRLALTLETEKPLEVFGRLNIRHGPNTEQLVREFPMDATEMFVEFDLGYSELNEKRIERIWLDLIFEDPGMNQIMIRDLTVTRRPRAEI
jgi:hypothetical protein